jgi:soluble lytic murein transglycosylase-like protein
MPCTVETASASLRPFGAAALVTATAMSSVLVADRAASTEPAPPMILREGGSAGDSLAAFIAAASQRFGAPASWIRAIMRLESVGDVHALSPTGAMGLMQIMPET